MKRKQYSIEIPQKDTNEELLTPKQKEFISHLLNEIEGVQISGTQINHLGKWQASSLIDGLIDIKDDN